MSPSAEHSPNLCPVCGTAIPAEAPSGLCPRCLLCGADPGEAAEATLPAVPGVIGPYRLCGSLGEGGMGQVFIAEQEEPIRRRVALKVIKPGMDSREILIRFGTERQALALMTHSSIARVLDAGATEDGRPYFVMELVEGAPLTDFCDAHRLTVRERVRLFLRICHAVQHAHQKGVIHRDLKPSNILVTISPDDDEPLPKIIDFGVSKALGPELTGNTLQTIAGQLIGTPQYMSPEQAAFHATDIDTRSDIYALGVILYELLIGSTPLADAEVREAGLEAMLRSIREQDAPRPSTRFGALAVDTRTTIAEARQALPSRLAQTIRGDLDRVVMKALEKERARRYETASAFAEDLQRYLRDEPVSAAAPSATYRFRKFARRNKAVLATGTAVVFLLIAGTGVSTWQAIRANENARREKAARLAADEARAEAEDVSRLFTGVFSSPDPARDGRKITVAELMDRAVTKLDHDLARQPDRLARVRNVIGTTYVQLGVPAPAVPLLEQARAHDLAAFGPTDRRTIEVSRMLTKSYAVAERWGDAISLAEELFARQQREFGADDPRTLAARGDLGMMYRGARRWKEALTIQEEVLAACRASLPPTDQLYRTSLLNLSTVLMDAGRFKEGLELVKEVRKLNQETLGTQHPDTIIARLNEFGLSLQVGLIKESIPIGEAVLDDCEEILGPENPHTLRAMNNLGVAYDVVGRFQDTLALRERILETRLLSFPKHHRVVLQTRLNIAVSYERLERFDDALALRKELVDLYRQHCGKADAETLLAVQHYAASISMAGKHEEALALEKEVLKHRIDLFGEKHPETLITMQNLAISLSDLDRLPEAAELEEKVLEIRRDVLGKRHSKTLLSMRNLAETYDRLDRRTDALRLRSEERLLRSGAPE